LGLSTIAFSSARFVAYFFTIFARFFSRITMQVFAIAVSLG